MIELPPKIDIDGDGGLFLLPFAKRQLARFKKLLPSGKRRWTMPTGEEVTIWWGMMRDRIRVTAKQGFEFLVTEGNTAGHPRLFGLVLNKDTGLYEVETNATIGTDFNFPPGSDTFFYLGHEDTDKVATLGVFMADRISTHYFRDKGKHLVGPFKIAAGPFSDFGGPRQSPAKEKLLLSNGTLMSLTTPEKTGFIWPSFDVPAFEARANAAWPDPWHVTFSTALFNVVNAFAIEGPPDGEQEFIIWRRYNQENQFFRFTANSIYMERYRIDSDLIRSDSAPGAGLTLVQTVSEAEDFGDPGSVFLATPIRFHVTPGPKGNASYTTVSPDPVTNVNLGGVGFINVYNLGNPLPPNSPHMPRSVQLNLPQSSTTIFNDTTGPAVCYPFFPHARALKAGEDVYWFINATACKPGLVFDHVDPDPPFTVFYQPTNIFEVTYQRMVSLNGTGPQISQQVRIYNGDTDTWSDTTPVDIYIPIVGHLVDGQPMFLGLRVRQNFVPHAQWDRVGFFGTYVPKTIFPAVFSPDLSVVHVYENVDSNINDDSFSVEESWSRVQPFFFIGEYKKKLFYVFNKTFAVGGPSVCWGVPVADPSVAPIAFPDSFGGQIPSAMPIS